MPGVLKLRRLARTYLASPLQLPPQPQPQAHQPPPPPLVRQATPAPRTAGDGVASHPSLSDPRSSSGGGYRIQVASGISQGWIAKEASRLRFDMPDLLSDLEVSIIQGEAGFTALLGPLTSPEEAEALCARLKERGLKSCSTVPP